MHLKRTALPITGVCLSLLMGCEPTHIKNGFESEAEMAQLNGMGYEKFEHFQNRGGFGSPERAREALSLGYMTNSEYNGNLVQEVTDIGTSTFYQQGTSAQKDEPLNEVLALISRIDDPSMRDTAISSYRMIRQQKVTQGARWSAEGTIYPNLNESFCEEDALLKAKLSDKTTAEQAGIVCTKSNLELLGAVKAKQAKEAEERANAELLAKQALERKVKDGGWSSVEKMKEGEAAGFSDQESYYAHILQQEEKRVAAELEKAIIESAVNAGKTYTEYALCEYALGEMSDLFGQQMNLYHSFWIFDALQRQTEIIVMESSNWSDEAKDAYQSAKTPMNESPEFKKIVNDQSYAASYFTHDCADRVGAQCGLVRMRGELGANAAPMDTKLEGLCRQVYEDY